MLRLPLLRPLREGPVALLWGGLATSAIGDQLFTVVLSWVAVRAFGTAAGYLAVLQAGTQLATSLLAGRAADRLDQRRVMVTADLSRAAMLLAMVAAWSLAGEPPVWSLLATVVVLAAGMSVFRPAMQASLPPLVSDTAMLPAANALLDTTERIARLLGPGLIGVASAFLPLVHFVTLDAVTFLVSAGAVLWIGRLRPPEPPPPPRRETQIASVVRGFATVRRHTILLWVLCVTWAINGAWYASFFLGLPLLIAHAGVVGPGGTGLGAYGLVISAYGSTNLAGTLFLGNRRATRWPGRMIFAGDIMLGLGIVILGLVGLLAPLDWMLPGFMLAAGVAAVGGPMQDILVATLRQTELPRADLPAAVRAFMTLNSGGLLVTLAVAPAVFNLIGVPQAVMACGAVAIGIGLVGVARFWRENATPAR